MLPNASSHEHYLYRYKLLKKRAHKVAGYYRCDEYVWLHQYLAVEPLSPLAWSTFAMGKLWLCTPPTGIYAPNHIPITIMQSTLQFAEVKLRDDISRITTYTKHSYKKHVFSDYLLKRLGNISARKKKQITCNIQ